MRLFGSRRGQSALEFALVGIPMLFVLVSTEEMARGMWMYHTQQQAIKWGARYAITKGSGCSDAGNTCTVTLGTVASQVANTGVGLDTGSWNVVFTAGGQSTTCNPLSSCTSSTAQWPPANFNSADTAITIVGTYPFTSALAMFWPTGSGGSGVQFNQVTLSAKAVQYIQF